MTKTIVETVSTQGTKTEVILKKGVMRVQSSLDALLETLEDSSIRGSIGGYYTSVGFGQEPSENILGIMLMSNERYHGMRHNPGMVIGDDSIGTVDEDALFANRFLANDQLQEFKAAGFQYFYSIPSDIIKSYH